MKYPGIHRTNNKLIKHLKLGLIKFIHFFFNLYIDFGIHHSKWKIAKVIMIHEAGSPEDLVRSYRPLSLTFCHSKLLEKTAADNLSNCEEYKSKFNKQNNIFSKNRFTNDNLFELFETIKSGFCNGHPTTGIFLDVDQVWYDGLLFKLTSQGLIRK